MKILAINPGSTSTKIAVYHDENQVMAKSLAHTAEELSQFEHFTEQYHFRKQIIEDELRADGIPLDFDAVIARGPLTRPIEGGVYDITPRMIDEALNAVHHHATDLGCSIAYDIAAEIPGCRSFIADPAVVDELNEYSRICGSPIMKRICIWHALNQRAIARRYAAEKGLRYEDLNLIVCHLGGGISVAAHDHGRAVDANNALDGEGPFSPERAGSLPAIDLVHLCYSGKYTEAELIKRIAGKAGLTGHLGTNDVREIISRIEAGDTHAELILNAMIYHVAKNIAAQGAVLFGNVDAILITGGMAYSQYIIDRLIPRIQYLAPVYVYPGEDEMLAMAQNALAVLRGEIATKQY